MLLLALALPARADRDADLAAVAAATQARSDTMIGAHVTRPFPAPAPDPGSPALGNAAYALSALWMDMETVAANQLLVDIRDGAFADEYWAMGQIVRTYMLFNCDSAFRPGRLTPEAEEALEDVIRRHLEMYSRVAEANEPTGWIIDGSENHDIMRRSANLLGAKILASDPARATLPLPDGALPAEHAAAWSAYFQRYLQERAKKGLFVERGSPTYAKYTLQSVFNLRDFAESQDVRDVAGRLIDLSLADAALEQLAGVRGGAKSRSYHDDSSARGSSDSGRLYLHLLAGVPPTLPLTQHPSALCAATSEHRLPRVILDLAGYPIDRGSYQYVSGGPAQGWREVVPAPLSTFWYHAEFPPALRRTTLATPGYVAGVHLVDPRATYMQIQSQNRWFGVIFSGGLDSRVYAQCVALQSGNRTAYDEMRGIGDGNAMLMQRLSQSTGGDLRVYFSSDLIREEAGGWVFARQPVGTGFIGVRPSRGSFAWDAPESTFPNGTWMHPDDVSAPLIFQLGLSTDFAGGFAAFKARVQANAMTWATPTELHYQPTLGREITWFTTNTLPQLGGVTVDLNPPKIMSAPYIDWDADSLAGTITATPAYASRTLALDFSVPTSASSRIVLEAESGRIAAPMIVALDVAASGRAFVHVPDTAGNGGGEIRFPFTTDASGDWTLWARMLAQDSGSNSFLESIDGDVPAVLGNGAATGLWTWVRGTTRMLAAGSHEVILSNREDGSRIDQIVLTASGDDSPPNTVTRVRVDSDGDGVTDEWMQGTFGHASGDVIDASRASDDGDADDETVRQEYSAGTNPLDAADYLKILLAKPAGSPAVRFDTRLASGPECPPPSRRYAVSTATDPRGPFTPIAGLDAIVGGAPIEAVLPTGTSLDFYLVDAQLSW